MELIYAYSRKQALEDGVLVDVTTLAQEAGIKYPVAVTSAVWQEYVVVPDGVPCQDEQGRLWDILWMLRVHIAGSKDKGSVLMFELYVKNDQRPAQRVQLKSVCGPGDDAEPVVTIMLPNED